MSANMVGLPQGFVRFGTMAHRILVHMREFGPQCWSDLAEVLEVDSGTISMTLKRLYEARLIYRYARRNAYETSTRAQWIYHYKAPHRPARAQRKSGAEMTREYRKRKQGRTPSIFQFRGQMVVADRHCGD